MLHKLRLKFVAVNMAIVLGMLLTIFALVYSTTEAQLDAVADNALRSLVQDDRQDVQLPYFTLQINLFGQVTVSGSSHIDLTDTHLMEQLIETVFKAPSREGYLEAYSLRYVHISLIGAEKVIFVDISGQQVALRALVESGILIGIAAMLLFLLISCLLANWAVKPVDQAWKKQKQFVSDASHELKTPLTVIMSNAELLTDESFDEEKKAQFVGNIQGASRQMRTLTEGLLELARADNGQVQKHFAELSVSELVADAVMNYEAVFFERGLQLQSNVEEGIRLVGSAQHLRQVVDVLLDNAGKYSENGIVDVRLIRSGRNCLLTVANPGMPIPKEQREKIFERFYRLDAARSEGGSFGLGLAIAKAAVQEHKGKIWVESNQSGNCFFVQLPCQSL